MAAAVECVQEVVHTFGEVRLRAFGTSMVPAILPGDLIFVSKVDISEVGLLDVVLWSKNHRLFIHRVVAFKGTPNNPVLVTRGDRLSHDDPPVGPDELLGRVTAIQRGDGTHKILEGMMPAKSSSAGHPLARLLQASDSATHLYVKLLRMQTALFFSED